MEWIQSAIEIFLHLDKHLNEWAGMLGPALYVLLFACASLLSTWSVTILGVTFLAGSVGMVVAGTTGPAQARGSATKTATAASRS